MTEERPRPRRRVAGERRALRRTPQAPAGPEAAAPPDAGDAEVGEAWTGEPLESAEQPAAEPAPRRRGPGRRWRARLSAPTVTWALGVLAIALSAVAGWQVVHERGARASADARPQALVAARTAAVALLSYDHRHLDADFARARKLLTPAFAKDYDETVKAVRPTATQYHAVVSASVSAAGLRSLHGNSAVALLFVNQTSTNDKHAEPRIDQSRVRMTLVRRDGRWLVSGLQAL